jgi:hypothetical protein
LTYDDHGRLRSFTSDWVYGPDQVYYAYDGESRLPVRDTLRGTFPNVFVEDLTYDTNGRIVRVHKRIVEQWEEDTGEYPDEIYTYYYDMRGNRQLHPSSRGYSGLIRYSDNPSVASLNPVWQLLYKNYSVNSTGNFTFNEHGLPMGRPEGGLKIEYDCE